jgi:hypothetical protein
MAALGGAGAPVAPAVHPYKIVGSGTFGSIIKPALPNEINGVLTAYPNNVTKVFYKKKAYNNVVQAVHKVQNIMNARSGPNAGHAVHLYTKKYKGINLPRNILTSIQSNKPNIINDTNLHLMRMPYLGVDFHNAVHKPALHTYLQHLPFPTILEQIVKLVLQTSSLAEQNHGHFDIRESNVMIHPGTGIMTIIDFDWLKPFHEFKRSYPFGFYNNPPECLLYRKWNNIFSKNLDGSYRFNYDQTNETSVKNFVTIEKLEEYTHNNYTSFSKYYTESGLTPVDIENNIYIELENNINIFRELKEADSTASEIFDRVLQSYDNFSLGLTLLNLLVTMYPTIVREDDTRTIIETLKPLLKNGDEPYTDAQFEIIVNSLKEITSVLMHLSSFRFEERYLPDTAVTRVQAILDECMAAWNPGPRGANANAAVAGGGRKRRRSRRRQ